MTATEELRRLLDERGVEWWPLGSNMTECVVDGVRIKYRQVGRGLIVSTCTEGTVKPEQAIAATLGRGTCHVTVQDNLAETEGMGDIWLECDACHWQMPLEPSTPRFNFCPNCGHRIVDPTTNDVDA